MTGLDAEQVSEESEMQGNRCKIRLQHGFCGLPDAVEAELDVEGWSSIAQHRLQPGISGLYHSFALGPL